MSTRPLLIAMVLGLVFSVSPPLAAHAADCTGVCNPDTDECCQDNCTYETEDAVCIPFNNGESCRTKKCTYNGNPNSVPTCTKGSFNSLPTGTECIAGDPCNRGTCNGSAVCVGQSNNPCADANQCTDDTCTASGTQGVTCPHDAEDQGTVCTIPNPDPCKNYECDGNKVCVLDADTPNKTDGTACGAFPSPGQCKVQSCSGGACTGSPNPGSTPVACAPGTCETATCSFSGSTLQCIKSNKPKGTVCDTDPWDCTHQRCDGSNPSVCKGYDTTTLKECDADTTTASHCKLSYCDSHKHCRTEPVGVPTPYYIHYMGADVDDNDIGHGVWKVEDAATLGRSNRVMTPQFLCTATDGNICTSDRCVGSNTDACHLYGCDIGDACPYPPCGDVCDIVSGNCTCRFN